MFLRVISIVRHAVLWSMQGWLLGFSFGLLRKVTQIQATREPFTTTCTTVFCDS